MDAQKIAEDNLLFYALSGSHAYGMNTETSDKDYRGIIYAPKDVAISVFKNIEQVEQFAGEKDAVVFELKKYLKLLTEQNPNILELLWVDDRFILHNTEAFKILREQRDFFLSTKAKHTFSGYAMSQLKRIKGHNKWINNPQPARRPKEIDFVSVVWNATDNIEWNNKVPLSGFDAYHLGGHIYGFKRSDDPSVTWYDRHEAIAHRDVVGNKQTIGTNFDILVKFNQQLYIEAVDNWKHYWTWKKERNETRSELEEKFGYDTKHAAHLIRLLRMGVEILRGEGVKVLRPDAQELLSIRQGAYTYEQIVTQAEDLDKELGSLYESSKLQHHIDQDKVDQIYRDILYYCWIHDAVPKAKEEARIGYKYYVESKVLRKDESNGT